jgi:hypothetical protein
MSGRPGPGMSATKAPSPNGSVASTPPGTPPVLPVPRAMLPANPLTPALAPDRSVTVSTSRGPRVVRAKDLSSHMDGVEEVVLPPQAAPDKARKQMQQRSLVDTPAPPPLPAPVVPVKHLVKLSSLSSLSSLIAPTNSPSMSPSPASASPKSGSPTLLGRSLPTGPPPPTFIILDIDETIHVNAYSPCLMMCEKGLEMYQRIISSHANYRNVSYAQKSGLTRTLQAALQSKRTVESHTSELLNQLQASNAGIAGAPPTNNIKIFGLTARFSHMASTTRKELLKLNIDLEKSSPFPMTVRKKIAMQNGWTPEKGGVNGSPQQSPQDRSLTPSPVLSAAITPLGSSPMPSLTLPSSLSSEYYPDVSWQDHPSHGTEAKYSQGVIYTNACEKGPVLARFLQFLWGKIEEDNAELMKEEERRKMEEEAEEPNSGNSSHSLMSISHAISSPISILASPPSPLPSTPSPDAAAQQSTLSLLAQASKPVVKKEEQVGVRGPHLSHLPTRVIFIDDRLQNCFSVYESLAPQTLFDKFYNGPVRYHVPTSLEVYTCHYVPPELNHPTNQTKVDAANNAETVDVELIECQIHHFLTHGVILNDAGGREQLEKIKNGGSSSASVIQKSLPAGLLDLAAAASPSTAAAVAPAPQSDVDMMEDVAASQRSSPVVDADVVMGVSTTPRNQAVKAQ